MTDFEGIDVLQLELCSPLFYSADEALIPFSGGDGECIFCFEAGGETEIDPEPENYLGKPFFSGRSAESMPLKGGFELPRGHYFFAQVREALKCEECIRMAIEVQREILWQRFVPEKKLYVRCLFEDGKPVTQVWRAYSLAASTI
jgi:hypothetical protein